MSITSNSSTGWLFIVCSCGYVFWRWQATLKTSISIISTTCHYRINNEHWDHGDLEPATQWGCHANSTPRWLNLFWLRTKLIKGVNRNKRFLTSATKLALKWLLLGLPKELETHPSTIGKHKMRSFIWSMLQALILQYFAFKTCLSEMYR